MILHVEKRWYIQFSTHGVYPAEITDHVEKAAPQRWNAPAFASTSRHPLSPSFSSLQHPTPKQTNASATSSYNAISYWDDTQLKFHWLKTIPCWPRTASAMRTLASFLSLLTHTHLSDDKRLNHYRWHWWYLPEGMWRHCACPEKHKKLHQDNVIKRIYNESNSYNVGCLAIISTNILPTIFNV